MQRLRPMFKYLEVANSKTMLRIGLLLSIFVTPFLVIAAPDPAVDADSSGAEFSKFLDRVLVFTQHFLSNGRSLKPDFGVLTYDSKASCLRVVATDGRGPNLGSCFGVEGEVHSGSYLIREDISQSRGSQVGLPSLPLSEFEFANVKLALQEIYDLEIDEDTAFDYRNKAIVDGDELILSRAIYLNGTHLETSSYSASFADEFVGAHVQLDRPKKDAVVRMSYKETLELHPELAGLRESVFRLDSDLNNEHAILDWPIKSSGSGFFVSDDGLFITNAHVLNRMPECSYRLVCPLTIARVLPNGEIASSSETIEIYAVSEGMDVVIGRLKNTQSVPLELEFEHLGLSVVAAGFPMDHPDELIISLGQLTGFNDKTLVTSAYGAPGSSGGPMLSLRSMKVIGITTYSHFVKSADHGPSSISPISVINHHLNVTDYIDGSMRKRLEGYIFELSLSMPHQAEGVLNQIEDERSLMAVPMLEQALVRERYPEKRAQILQSINRLKELRSKRF